MIQNASKTSETGLMQGNKRKTKADEKCLVPNRTFQYESLNLVVPQEDSDEPNFQSRNKKVVLDVE